VFVPQSIGLREAGPADPYGWLMTETLTWSGIFRGTARQLEVPATPAHPFSTDLASVPRSLTWLFPRYGKYTKAAVLHDYLCQNFRSAPSSSAAASSLLPLTDRSDADEMFLVVMKELGVPRLRRWLMWGAVSWATVITSLVPGRRSNPVLRRVGRAVVVVALLALFVAALVRRDLATVAASIALAPAVVMAGGTIALGRRDRAFPYTLAYLLTLVFSPLLAIGLVLGMVLYLYFFVEDVFAGLPATRTFLRDLFSRDAKLEKLATPQFARLAAVIES
jgi:hypothetical protein